MDERIVYGVHPVMALLHAGRGDVARIYLASSHNKKIILAAAKACGVIVSTASKDTLTRMAGTQKHQGVVASVVSKRYRTLDEILEIPAARKEPPFIWVLDGVEDPRNLGAILRTMDAVGAHGVVIPKHRAAGITATVSKTSAGADAYVAIAQAGNVSTTVSQLKKEGLWVVGMAHTAKLHYDQYDFSGPVAIVVGGESGGIHQKVLEQCDQTISLPMRGTVSSLNVSVAVGVVGYEVVRQRTRRSYDASIAQYPL